MQIASVPSRILRWFQAGRCTWLLVMVLLCLGLRENYPFSHFPMYSSFSDHTYFLYLADKNDRAIATRRLGLSSSTLKKIFGRRWRNELEKFEHAGPADRSHAETVAAVSLLHYLDGLAAHRREARTLLAGAKIQHVLVHQKSGVIVLETRTLAQHR
jgi:hypothetical protein